MALAIVKDNEIVYLKGYGQADPSGRSMTPQTPLILGSITKSFTAVAVMQLVEAGKVELDGPLERAGNNEMERCLGERAFRPPVVCLIPHGESVFLAGSQDVSARLLLLANRCCHRVVRERSDRSSDDRQCAADFLQAIRMTAATVLLVPTRCIPTM